MASPFDGDACAPSRADCFRKPEPPTKRGFGNREGGEQAARVSCFCRKCVKNLQNQGHFKVIFIAGD